MVGLPSTARDHPFAIEVTMIVGAYTGLTERWAQSNSAKLVPHRA